LLGSLGIEPGGADRVRVAARKVDDVRFAASDRPPTHSH
jgi:hypothetical protein